LTNIASTHLLKPYFKRPRPVAELDAVNFMVTMKKYGWAFPSTHTAMAAALSVVLWRDYPKARPVLAVFNACVGFFCVYTGGHYPLDVAAGLILGVVIGLVVNFLKNKAAYTGKR
ncbi:MAG TPA: phosphatase PAP2 family protein, partial [Candidatus Goldiibacteriota bacterium]|nr:phosphatase PAP2 family protein [Candidatus Goldiibacteriota bacterium]